MEEDHIIFPILKTTVASVWEYWKDLEIDSGDDYTTMWVYLMPLQYTLKVKMVNIWCT